MSDVYGLNLEGDELEEFGLQILRKMDVECIKAITQVPLRSLDPNGSYNNSEHLEIDYLVPYSEVCIVGEISARSNTGQIRDKDARSRRHLDILRQAPKSDPFWRSLGVPEDKLYLFSHVIELKQLSILTRQDRNTPPLEQAQNCVRFYQPDWKMCIDYANGIGGFAKPYFYNMFGLVEEHQEATVLDRRRDLITIPRRLITGSSEILADVFLFPISPYKLLPIAKVFRRDDLPDISDELDDNYQRPLIPDKLKAIRNMLLSQNDFMFPNSILLELSQTCEFSQQRGKLTIPMSYGSVSVIDGQHRLFSYADPDIKRRLESRSKLLVTAIRFHQPQDIPTAAARTFIEINSNQTPISSTHLDAIAYGILGDNSPRAVAAHIASKINENQDLCGMFRTSRTPHGKVQVNTVISSIKIFSNIERIRQVGASSNARYSEEKQGYINLFGKPFAELADVNIFVEASLSCVLRYFRLLKRAFKYDWPEPRKDKNSTFEFAKTIAALAMCLHYCIREGYTWAQVEEKIGLLKTNVMTLRQVRTYNTALFSTTDASVPDARHSVNEIYSFMQEHSTFVGDEE